MTGCAAVMASSAGESADKQHIVLETDLKCLGVLGKFKSTCRSEVKTCSDNSKACT